MIPKFQICRRTAHRRWLWLVAASLLILPALHSYAVTETLAAMLLFTGVFLLGAFVIAVLVLTAAALDHLLRWGMASLGVIVRFAVSPIMALEILTMRAATTAHASMKPAPEKRVEDHGIFLKELRP